MGKSSSEEEIVLRGTALTGSGLVRSIVTGGTVRSTLPGRVLREPGLIPEPRRLFEEGVAIGLVVGVAAGFLDLIKVLSDGADGPLRA